jgi:hypothetical protein
VNRRYNSVKLDLDTHIDLWNQYSPNLSQQAWQRLLLETIYFPAGADPRGEHTLMETIADKYAKQISSIKRWGSPAIVLITFSDASQVGFDASNDKRPIPTGDITSVANEFTSNTKTIRAGKHGPEVVFQDDSWIICTTQHWTAQYPE